MTVRATGAAPLAETSPAASSPPAELRTIWGVVLGGSLSGDVIIASPEAMAIVRAGRMARAFIIAGLERLRRVVPLQSGRSLRVEFGIYRLGS